MEDLTNQAAAGESATSDKYILVLRKPVVARGKQVTEVVLREPEAEELHLASVAKSSVAALLTLISLTASVPLDVAEGMASRDLAEAGAYFESFALPEPVQEDEVVDETVIELRKPITLGKGDGAVTYTQLELSEPTGRDKDKAAREPSDTRAAIALISILAKMPRAAVGRLCRRDFEEACNFLGTFNVAGPTTGGK